MSERLAEMERLWCLREPRAPGFVFFNFFAGVDVDHFILLIFLMWTVFKSLY